VTARSINEKFNQETETSQEAHKRNAEQNLGKQKSAMKTKNGPIRNLFRENDRTSITLFSATVLR